MNSISDIVDQLNSRSDAERRGVLRQISGLFMERVADHTDREAEIFGRVFVELMEQLPHDDRIDFSDQFAIVPQAPSEVVQYLADDDDPRVASPMLERSSALTDEALRAIAGRRGGEHLVAIARRKHLDADLTDILVNRGGSEVLETLSLNNGATFSDGGLARLARTAFDSEPIAHALFRRLDITIERFGHVLATIEEKARDRLARLLVTNRSAVTSLLKNTLEEASTRRERERAETKAMITLARAGVRRLDGCVDDLALDERIEDLAHLLAAFAELDETHVATVLRSGNDFGLVLVCRSLDIGELTWLALDRLRRRASGSESGSPDPVLSTYREMDKASADRALRFHRIKTQLK